MIAKCISLCIRIYQFLLSPLFTCLGCGCRYYPSCSHYALICLKKYSLTQALRMSIRRLLRCHPFASSGVDLP